MTMDFTTRYLPRKTSHQTADMSNMATTNANVIRHNMKRI